jgi:copper resistance protein D
MLLKMVIFDALIVWVHLICSSIWVGGSIFLGIVLAPEIRNMKPNIEDRLSLMIRFGRKFNAIALPSFLILIVTGIYNSRTFIFRPNDILEMQYGQILIIKILVAVAILVIYIIHIRIFSTKTEEEITSGKLDLQYLISVRTKIIWLGRITVFLSIIVLLLAALLDSGI